MVTLRKPGNIDLILPNGAHDSDRQLALETQKLSLSSNDTIKATQGDVNLLKDATSKAQIDITSTKDATLELQQYAQLAKSGRYPHTLFLS